MANSTYLGFHRTLSQAFLPDLQDPSMYPTQKCHTLIPGCSIDDAMSAHLFTEIKDELCFPQPLGHPQASLYLDGVERILPHDTAWKSVVSSANFVDNSVQESLWGSSVLSSNLGLESSKAALSANFFREKSYADAAQQFLLLQEREETPNTGRKSETCPLIRSEEIDTLKEEPLHNVQEAQVRCTVNVDQQSGFSEMPNTVKDERPKMIQSSSPKHETKKRKATAKEIVPSPNPSSSDKHSKKTQADSEDEMPVKKCKASPCGDGQMSDSMAGKEQSCMSDSSIASQEKSGVEPPKQDYVHVRARRGQATDSHSLAERVRREKISERMKVLQNLVPNCNKVVRKALMLDEIINYVQSLQRQVELLSMKLAIVSSTVDFNMYDYNHSQINSNCVVAPASSMVHMVDLAQTCFREGSTTEDYGSTICEIGSQGHLATGVMPYLGY